MRQTLADTVVLDSSAVGRPAMTLGADDLVALSRSTGGGFQQTCHYAGRVRVSGADVALDLMALHYLPDPAGDVWALFRPIVITLNPDGLISQMRTLSERSAGNTGLLAAARNNQQEHPQAVAGPSADLVDRFFGAIEGIRWKCIHTADPDVTLVAYEQPGGAVGGVVFYAQGGLIRKVEGYKSM